LDDRQQHFEEELARFKELFEQHYLRRMRAKLGLTTEEPGDADLVHAWLQHLQDNGLDYTLSFQRLSTRIDADSADDNFGTFEIRWKQRLAKQPESSSEIQLRMDKVNPLYIPRNHQVERAIQAAVAGDPSVFHELNQVLRKPFEEQPEYARYASPPLAEERVTKTFCGT
jgi:uncharacterized protein YdiU (UPF0061 family)